MSKEHDDLFVCSAKDTSVISLLKVVEEKKKRKRKELSDNLVNYSKERPWEPTDGAEREPG